jgi:hypothetical protein
VLLKFFLFNLSFLCFYRFLCFLSSFEFWQFLKKYIKRFGLWTFSNGCESSTSFLIHQLQTDPQTSIWIFLYQKALQHIYERLIYFLSSTRSNGVKQCNLMAIRCRYNHFKNLLWAVNLLPRSCRFNNVPTLKLKLTFCNLPYTKD